MSHLHFDFETTSELDLKTVGVHTYAEHPSTRVLCACWKFSNDVGNSINSWDIRRGVTNRLKSLFMTVRGGASFHAFNAEFEWIIWNRVFLPQLLPAEHRAKFVLRLSQMRCTMAQAAQMGLPQSLDQVGEAMRGLGRDNRFGSVIPAKDMNGQRNMMRMARPRKARGRGQGPTWWHEDEPDRLDALVAYCADDVRSEAAISSRLPPLTASELDLWRQTCRENALGVGIDLDLVAGMEDVVKRGVTAANDRISSLTGGEVQSVNQVSNLLTWLQAAGVKVNSCTRAELQGALASSDTPSLARAVIETRLDAAKTSTSKLNKMRAVSDNPKRVARGLLSYYGATRTGRFAGRLIQPQNMPRGVLKADAYEQAIDALLGKGPLPAAAANMSPLAVVSSCLRGVFVPQPSRATHFCVGDFSQIEARVLAWLAKHYRILDVFASGEDVYTYAAAAIGSDDRLLGKVMTLGLGYQMGPKRFMGTAEGYGLVITESEAEDYVRKWRKANLPITELWYGSNDRVMQLLNDIAPHLGSLSCADMLHAAGLHIPRPLHATTMGREHVEMRLQYSLQPMLRNPARVNLHLHLPTGRDLIYYDAGAYDPDPEPGDPVDVVQNPYYFPVMAVNPSATPRDNQQAKPRTARATFLSTDLTGKAVRDHGYGGKFVENATQAVARDVMAAAKNRILLEEPRLQPLLSVHDELICEFDENVISPGEAEARLHELMTAPVPWPGGEDLPVGAEVYVAKRYRK